MLFVLTALILKRPVAIKKNSNYSARGAAKGYRSKKSGRSPFFVGYKKHTFWLINKGPDKTVVIPLKSFIDGANVDDAVFVKPFIEPFSKILKKHDLIIVADRSYMDDELKRDLRTCYHVALLTDVKKNMFPPSLCNEKGEPLCKAGAPLKHLEYDKELKKHIYAGLDFECCCCGLRHNCPKEFLISPDSSEHYLGLIPLHTKVAKRLLKEYRPVCEQGFLRDKQFQHIGNFYANSLDLVSIVSHVSDTCSVLKIIAEMRIKRGKQVKHVYKNNLVQLRFDFMD